MSNLVRSEGIVLRSRTFRESSKITTAITLHSGKIDLVAHGARKPGSRFGAGLEPGTYAEFIYYEKKDKDLWTLSSVDIINSNQKLRENIGKLETLINILRLFSWVSHAGELNTGAYNLTLSVLNHMDTAEDLQAVYGLYLWRLTSINGHAPHLSGECVECGRKGAVNFSVSAGGLLCEKHSRGEIFRLNRDELVKIVDLSELPIDQAFKSYSSNIQKLIKQYSRYHLHAGEKIIP